MTLWQETIAVWVANYYWSSTVLLSVAIVIRVFLLHPAKRVALGWSTAVGLLLLAACTVLPARPTMPWSALVPLGRSGYLATGHTDVDARQSADTIARSASNLEPSKGTKLQPPRLSWVAHWSWLICGTFFTAFLCTALRLTWGALQVTRLIWQSKPAPISLQSILCELSAAAKLPRVRVSQHIDCPAVACAWRPTILLPVTFFERNSPQSIRCVLAHELAHIQNNDLWLALLGRLLLPLLGANPLIWLWRQSIREDQELLADATAASQTGACHVAEALLAMARELRRQNRAVPAGLGIFDRHNSLSRRINMLLHGEFAVRPRGLQCWRWGTLVAGALCAVALSVFTFEPARGADESTDADATHNSPDLDTNPTLAKLPPQLRDLMKQEAAAIEDLERKAIELKNAHKAEAGAEVRLEALRRTEQFKRLLWYFQQPEHTEQIRKLQRELAYRDAKSGKPDRLELGETEAVIKLKAAEVREQNWPEAAKILMLDRPGDQDRDPSLEVALADLQQRELIRVLAAPTLTMRSRLTAFVVFHFEDDETKPIYEVAVTPLLPEGMIVKFTETTGNAPNQRKHSNEVALDLRPGRMSVVEGSISPGPSGDVHNLFFVTASLIHPQPRLIESAPYPAK